MATKRRRHRTPVGWNCLWRGTYANLCSGCKQTQARDASSLFWQNASSFLSTEVRFFSVKTSHLERKIQWPTIGCFADASWQVGQLVQFVHLQDNDNVEAKSMLATMKMTCPLAWEIVETCHLIPISMSLKVTCNLHWMCRELSHDQRRLIQFATNEDHWITINFGHWFQDDLQGFSYK